MSGGAWFLAALVLAVAVVLVGAALFSVIQARRRHPARGVAGSARAGMTTAEIVEHLERLSYKPGWSFSAYEGRFEGPHVVIRTELEDAFHPGSTVTLDIHSMLPPMRDERALEEWLAWRLGRIEVHEMREFLRRDGEIIFDPHAPGAEHDR